ncbi:hypothetical protein JCM5350_006122 [Sporobolomyces pararoseus]
MEAAMSALLGGAVFLADKLPDLYLRWRTKQQSDGERAKVDPEFGGKLRWQRVYSAIKMDAFLKENVLKAIDLNLEYLESTFIPEIYGWERFEFIDDLRHDRLALAEDASILDLAAEHNVDFLNARKIAPLPKKHLRTVAELESELQKSKEDLETLRRTKENERSDLAKQFEQEKEDLVPKAEFELMKREVTRAKEESDRLRQEMGKLKEQQSRISQEEEDELRKELEESRNEQKRLKEELERARVELEESREEARRLKEELGNVSIKECDTVSEAATESSSLEPLLDVDSTDSSLPAMQLHDIVEELARFKLRLESLEAREAV